MASRQSALPAAQSTSGSSSNDLKNVRLPPLLTPDAPVFNTQIINFPINKHLEIWKPRSSEGKTWLQFLAHVEKSPGFQRLYWGKVVDIELLQGKTQLHIVKDTLEQHFEYLKSAEWKQALGVLAPLLDSTREEDTIIRHGVFGHQSAKPRVLGPECPFAGTAIYMVNDPYGFQGAWQLWSTIIIKTKGCTGVTGGWLVDEKKHGSPFNFLVYVGWETMELHHEHHMTKEYRRQSTILDQCNTGYREYGHVKFLAEKKKKDSSAKI
jgi:hypothetical protein